MKIKYLFTVLSVAVVLEGCAATYNRVQSNGLSLTNGAMLNNGAVLQNGARRAALTALAARPLTKQD